MNDGKSSIGTLNEKPLHADLKAWYARPGDRFEVKLKGFFIDIVRGEELIEIQTRSLGALKRKIQNLLDDHPVTLIHPVAINKWIVRVAQNGTQTLGRRQSPKHGNLLTAFEELVSIPHLLAKPNFKLVIPLVEEEELRQRSSRRAWRKNGWEVFERRLLNVVMSHTFETPQDYLNLLPSDLPESFTTADLAHRLGSRLHVGQQLAYCLYKMSFIERIGKQGRYILYRR